MTVAFVCPCPGGKLGVHMLSGVAPLMDEDNSVVIARVGGGGERTKW